MVEVAARLILGGVLAGAAVAKLAGFEAAREAVAGVGVAGRRVQGIVLAALIAVELGLAAGVIAGSATAAYLAAALMATFAATMVSAILRGRAGAPCACFGARSTVGWPAVGRNALLAAGFAALPALPASNPSTDQWLGIGLGVALLACAALSIAVLALAREVGMLRLRLGPGQALELVGEGPDVGSREGAIARFAVGPRTELALGVFLSAGCHVCHGLEPAIRSLAADPILAVESFDETADSGLWSELAIPGAPFAIAFDSSGVVLAKGAFNNLAQLESVVATAGRRRDQRSLVESFGV